MNNTAKLDNIFRHIIAETLKGNTKWLLASGEDDEYICYICYIPGSANAFYLDGVDYHYSCSLSIVSQTSTDKKLFKYNRDRETDKEVEWDSFVRHVVESTLPVDAVDSIYDAVINGKVFYSELDKLERAYKHGASLKPRKES